MLTIAAVALLLNTKPVQLDFVPDSNTIEYDKSITATLTAETDPDWKPVWTDLRSRFKGFSKLEEFTATPIEINGKIRHTLALKLTPDAKGPWKLAPFVFTITNIKTGTTETFATQPYTFKSPTERIPVTGKMEADIQPERIPPTLLEYSVYLLLFLVTCGIGFLIVIAIKHIKRKVKEFKMTPSERANAELARLLARNLIEIGDYKTFYVELTLIVRRYIERTTGVRASRQTTQEFLAASLNNQKFSAEELARLADFLKAADMIKFAGAKATQEQANSSIIFAKAAIAKTTDSSPKDDISVN